MPSVSVAAPAGAALSSTPCALRPLVCTSPSVTLVALVPAVPLIAETARPLPVAVDPCRRTVPSVRLIAPVAPPVCAATPALGPPPVTSMMPGAATVIGAIGVGKGPRPCWRRCSTSTIR
ncbi:MAG: hypothetical protein WDN24_06340 [Sphingomonas sp.]